MIRTIATVAVAIVVSTSLPAQQAANSTSNGLLTITLQDALDLARKNAATYRAAVTDAAIAHEDKVQARAGLLPSVSYTTEYLYTEG
jgi:outer membrane protein TolC